MSELPHLLLVDDDPLVLPSLSALLERSGFRVTAVPSAEQALTFLAANAPRVMVTDLNLPEMDGIELLQRARDLHPGLSMIVLTAYGSVDSAVQAMRHGARDYVLKPVDDFELTQKIRRALDEEHLQSEVEDLRRRVAAVPQPKKMQGHHPAMQRVAAMSEAVAATRATVMIRGESGTGKTMLARLLHAMSDRADGPFVEFSCGTLPDPLLESELFGHEKGAFTGADRSRPGKIEMADGGTLFLDEIANATPALQIKLLRVLQDRTFERLGDVQVRKVDIRLILATNADLEQLVKEGGFREDLFYRINVVNIALPALRDRRADIPLLAEHFLHRYAQEYRKAPLSIDPSAMAMLEGHDWPGNVRELENAIEHAVVLTRGPFVKADHLPMRFLAGRESVASDNGDIQSLRKAMEVPEREYIRRVLQLNDGNRQKTADMLEVNRTTLFNKMKKYQLFMEESSH